MTLRLHYGNAVSGEQRYPRPQLEARLMRTLNNSGGIKMFGLRRIGKSTLRRYVVECLQQQEKAVAFVDAQGLHGVADLLAELFAALPKESGLTSRALALIAKDSPIRNLLEGLAKGTKIGDNMVAAYWREAYNGIRNALAQSTAPVPVLVIDEFSLLIQNMLARQPDTGTEDANQLLAAMREWRDKGMKMLLTGSIGITALARRYRLNRDHLNDLLPFDVPELSVAEARDFIEQAAATAGTAAWTAEHTDEFMRQSGVLYPSFLVKGLLAIDLAEPPPAESLAAIFAQQVRPVLHDDFYTQFNSRFKFYDQIDPACRSSVIVPALKCVMDSNAPVQLDDLALPAAYTRIDLAEFMDMLVEDGFLSFTEDAHGERAWLPASRLVWLWWKRARLA